MQGRGVMIDLARHYGRDTHAVNYDDLMRILDADRIEIRQGDILLFHTEFGDALLEMGRNPDPKRVHAMCGGLDGSDDRLLQWITDSRIAVGLPLGEMWCLGALARWLQTHGRTDFLLTAPPLNLPGAVGSPATPIATV